MRIKSAVRDYDVYLCRSLEFLEKISEIKECFYVVDGTVWKLYFEALEKYIGPDRLMVLPISEDRKTLFTAMEVYDALMSRAAKRNMTLISIGGGITQDVTGFAASTLYRGIGWIFVPTTLLAQADSCIGSKTSLNYKHYKNLVGTFFPPNEVYLDPGFLSTLSTEDFFSGVGEVIKLHLMGGPAMTELFSGNAPRIRAREAPALLEAIRNSLQVKLSYLEGDEFDTGRRNLLNYGHCFGHALESTSDFAVPHGQAVLVGMQFANIAAKNRGLLSDKDYDYLTHNIIKPNLVSRINLPYLEVDRIYSAMKMDKKRTGEGLVLIMLTNGHDMIKVTDFGLSELDSTINALVGVLGLK